MPAIQREFVWGSPNEPVSLDKCFDARFDVLPELMSAHAEDLIALQAL